MEEYNIDDMVVWTGHLGRVIGKTTGGKVVVEWPTEEVEAIEIEQLFLVEKAKDENKM